MNVITTIAKHKTLILIIGMLAGFSIIAQPVVNAYVASEIAYEVEKNAASDEQRSAESEHSNETQISTLHAVTPTAQMQLSPLNLILEDQLSSESIKATTWVKLAVYLPEKLLKVLFNIIIAPNAP